MPRKVFLSWETEVVVVASDLTVSAVYEVAEMLESGRSENYV